MRHRYVKITQGENPRATSLTVDDLDITHVVTSYSLTHAARWPGDLPELRLSIRPSLQFFGHAVVRAEVDAEVRDLLIDAGWTPPRRDEEAI